jgi:hypothetical protein
MLKSLLVSSLLFSQVTAFSVTPNVHSPLTRQQPQPPQHQRPQQRPQQQRPTALSPLFMGRAAAVREKTKGKTDARKAKTNAVFGKRIIMAVKQGGSPDPNANSLLANIIRLAKNNSVPVDVSQIKSSQVRSRQLPYLVRLQNLRLQYLTLQKRKRKKTICFSSFSCDGSCFEEIRN